MLLSIWADDHAQSTFALPRRATAVWELRVGLDLPFSACAGKGCFREISQIKLRTWPNNDDKSLNNELREQFYTNILDRQIKCRGKEPSKAISERPLKARQHFSRARSSHIAQQPIFTFLGPINFSKNYFTNKSAKQRTFLEIEISPTFK